MGASGVVGAALATSCRPGVGRRRIGGDGNGDQQRERKSGMKHGEISGIKPAHGCAAQHQRASTK